MPAANRVARAKRRNSSVEGTESRSMPADSSSKSHRPKTGSTCACTPAAYRAPANSGMGGGQVAIASGPARSTGRRAAKRRSPSVRKSAGSAASKRRRPRTVIWTSRDAPEVGEAPLGMNAAWPAEAGSVFDPNTDRSTHSGKYRISPSWPSARSSYRNAPASRTLMWSLAAARARRARSVSGLGAAWAAGAPCAVGGGISSEKMGRAPPRREPPVRRAPRRTAATSG